MPISPAGARRVPELEPTLAERLGGRWAISWQAVAISAPVGILGVVLTSQATSAAVALRWALAGAFAVACVAIWTYLLHLTVFRHRARRPLPMWIVVLGALASGAVFAVSLAWFARAVDLTSEPLSMVRLLSTIAVATWWGITVQLMLEARWRFAVRRDVLIERAVEQRLTALREAEMLDRIRESLLEEVSEELADARDALDRRIAALSAATRDEFAVAAHEVRETAASSVRPLSHRLAEQVAVEHPPPTFGDAMRAIVRVQPMRPLAVSIIYAASSGPRDIRELGSSTGTLVFLLSIALIVLIMNAANALMRRRPGSHARIFITALLLLEGSTVVLSPWRASLAGNPVSWADTIVSVIIGTIVVLVTSGFGSWKAARAGSLALFVEQLREEDLETIARSRAVADASRDAARMLHGAVQTKLVACAMAIDHAAATGDAAAVSRALVEARSVLDEPFTQVGSAAADLGRELERKAGLWRGLADVTIDIDPLAAAITGTRSTEVASVVEEAIANAIRHGSATTVTVDVVMDGSAINVRVRDNGSGPAGGSPGLGSTYASSVSDGQWALRPAGSGSELTMRIGL